jgi:hypothetical protein
MGYCIVGIITKFKEVLNIWLNRKHLITNESVVVTFIELVQWIVENEGFCYVLESSNML